MTLYPTWFRWKCISFSFCYCRKSFISHMVQMKGWFRKRFSTRTTTFISHMVQMKVWMSSVPRCLRHLYIPHGSDESRHGVAVRSSLKALYPTWFRWKETVVSTVNVWLNFISHMVQMKDFTFKRSNETSKALYPTWFRWKGSCQRAINIRCKAFIYSYFSMF